MKLVDDFIEYQILDMTNGEKLENWNGVILRRPDPQIIWDNNMKSSFWSKTDARYYRKNTGGGYWDVKSGVLDSWQIQYHDMVFNLKLMGFKHTGLFPEQAYNWNLIRKKIRDASRKVKVLNLFAYTGGASIAALMEHADVVHVDASRGMIEWAKENVKSNHLEDEKIHFFVDDVVKFVRREIRRGNKYDIIIMDPPSFGRGSKNEVWNIEKDLYGLVDECVDLLSNEPILFLINSYSAGLSKTILENILNLTVNKKYHGFVSSDELGIRDVKDTLVLPCGVYGRWEKNKSE